ncbi:ABC transporter ATP-binding protein [Comamonas piscis]
MIETDKLRKTHGTTTVLHDVTLRIPQGRLTAIIGPNGAGKSTALSLISRLMPMTSGQVRIEGQDINTTASDALARVMAILRQDNQSALRLTVRDLVAFGRFPHSKGRLTEEDRVQVDAALNYLHLQPLSERFLDELSGGQRQRAYIAMVLCQNTRYILFDEPLNNLDMAHAVGMMKLLRQAVQDAGKTVVVVLHDINFAASYADHIIAMKAGALYCEGPPEVVVRDEVLSDLYEIPVQVHELNGRRFCDYF